MDSWIEVFKTGRHTDSAGNTREWTQADLDKIADISSAIQAPAVIGHPGSDSPAWGWLDGVKTEAGSLFVKFKDIVPEFAEMVKKKMFPNRSIALNQDLSIRHIGFLGAAAPAVKGLEGIKFQETKAIVIEFMYKKEYNKQGEEMKSGTKPGVGEDDMDKKAEGFKFTEKDVADKLKIQSLEFAKADKLKDDRIAALEAESKGNKVLLLKTEIKAFCESLKKDGKLLPAWEKMGLGEFMLGLGSADSFEFSAGTKETQISFFKRFLSELPKVIEFEEIAARAERSKRATFRPVGDVPVHQESLAIHEKVIAYQEQNKGVSYQTAFEAVI